MRLQETYFVCKSAVDNWIDLNFKEQDNFYWLTNWAQIYPIFRELSAIEILSATIIQIRSLSVSLNSDTETPCLNTNTSLTLRSLYEELFEKLLVIVSLCEDTLQVELCDSGFDIKMPPNISLEDFSGCTNDLNKLISQCPILNICDNCISFKAVDVGSIWLNFFVVGSAAVILLDRLAVLVDKAIIIKSHILTCKEQEEKVKTLGLQNDMLESMVNINKQVLNALLQDTAKILGKEYDISEPEEIERIRFSLSTLSDWMIKGLEVYAAVNQSQEVKAVFKPIEQQKFSANTIEKLSESTDIED